jgi:LuxR family maltose regulon positive regulatory protein
VAVTDVHRSTLAPPPLPRDLVSRPALRAELDSGADRALTLVCAPPGFGKSLVLADWARRCTETATAWVSLTRAQNVPAGLWAAVLAALRACPAVPPTSVLRRIPASHPDPRDDVLAGLAALPRPIRLVLDDAHHLRGAETAEHLRALVRDRGPAVQLVLASRMDPPLPLARMRLAGELCELRTDRLRLSPRETEQLLHRTGLRLTPRQAALLHERTGGWVAGVRLAACSPACRRDPERFLAEFSGDERSVADFLVGEVLAGIPEDRREVLRRVSIADPVPAALAVELCGREDAADVLDELGHETGLISVATDRADYRVQELLRSYLEADLHRRGRAGAAALHRRAALWWEAQGRPVEAMRHGSRAGDPAFLGGMLVRCGARLAGEGERDVLRDALRVTGSTAEARMWSAALSAQDNLLRGDRRAVAEDVRRARREGPPTAGSETAVLLTATARLAGLSRCVRPGHEPVPDDPALAAFALAGRGAAEVLAGTVGTVPTGRADLRAALDTAHRWHLPLLEVECLCLLGAAAWAAGDLREAAARADRALALSAAGGWPTSGWAAVARAVGALTAVERAQPEAALALADDVAPDEVEIDPVVRYALGVARGAALFDIGDRAAGLLELQRARSDSAGRPVPPVLAAAGALLENRIALRLGYTRAAAAAGGRLDGLAGVGCERLLMRGWAAGAAEAHREARQTVEPLLGAGVRPARPGTPVEAWLVVAEVALRHGDRPGSRHALRTALDRAAPMDLVRPFVTASEPVRALLVDELVGEGVRGRFAAQVLVTPRPGSHPGATTLTAREEDVLALLPSLLNLDEIAVDLAVSVNTVKSHVRSIYDKLGVGTRRRAVLAAHERGMLRRRPAPLTRRG